eukprot:m.194019 g.194019  ORF g.194019 m.194019 type:complete len:51 (-) comp15446_c3_seq1:95-247(-)
MRTSVCAGSSLLLKVEIEVTFVWKGENQCLDKLHPHSAFPFLSVRGSVQS